MATISTDIMQIEQESCQTVTRLFEIINEKHRPQHNMTMLSLQSF